MCIPAVLHDVANVLKAWESPSLDSSFWQAISKPDVCAHADGSVYKSMADLTLVGITDANFTPEIQQVSPPPPPAVLVDEDVPLLRTYGWTSLC